MKKMKLKTKSSVKKRFNLTAKGKIISTQSGKRHGMIKRSKSNIRGQRGTTVLHKSDFHIIKSYMPYGV
ncbi:MAG: 50S ribosomal protein L35 [Wolbachia endosymbiont of Meromenopon meropis]|nr:50S ribosomal protein L35 [Wolbachia endosymbiont of Meromenopon meropis]